MIVDFYCNYIRSTAHWVVPGHEANHNPENPTGDAAVFFEHEVLNGKVGEYPLQAAYLFEPKAKYPKTFAFVEDHIEEFVIIYTCNRALADRYPNVEFMPFGTGWTLGVDIPEKTVRIGMIISNKPMPDSHLEGYRQRYGAAQELRRRTMPVYGSGVGAKVPRSLVGKFEFAIEAENCREPCYFTEKLIDCLLMKTVPLYFGPSCVEQYFDMRGIFMWDSLESLYSYLDMIVAGEMRYVDFQEILEHNRELALPLARTTSRWLPPLAEVFASCQSSLSPDQPGS